MNVVFFWLLIYIAAAWQSGGAPASTPADWSAAPLLAVAGLACSALAPRRIWLVVPWAGCVADLLAPGRMGVGLGAFTLLAAVAAWLASHENAPRWRLGRWCLAAAAPWLVCLASAVVRRLSGEAVAPWPELFSMVAGAAVGASLLTLVLLAIWQFLFASPPAVAPEAT